MCVPCIQSASMMIRYTTRYLLRNALNSACSLAFATSLSVSVPVPLPLSLDESDVDVVSSFSSAGVMRDDIK